MENKLYIIGIKENLEHLAECVGLVDTFSGTEELAYFGFWDKVCIIEYNAENDSWWIKEFGIKGPRYINCIDNKELFKIMDEEKIQFPREDNPLGEIFQSYTAAYLQLVCWAADVAYTKDKLYNLLEE